MQCAGCAGGGVISPFVRAAYDDLRSVWLTRERTLRDAHDLWQRQFNAWLSDPAQRTRVRKSKWGPCSELMAGGLVVLSEIGWLVGFVTLLKTHSIWQSVFRGLATGTFFICAALIPASIASFDEMLTSRSLSRIKREWYQMQPEPPMPR